MAFRNMLDIVKEENARIMPIFQPTSSLIPLRHQLTMLKGMKVNKISTSSTKPIHNFLKGLQQKAVIVINLDDDEAKTDHTGKHILIMTLRKTKFIKNAGNMQFKNASIEQIVKDEIVSMVKTTDLINASYSSNPPSLKIVYTINAEESITICIQDKDIKIDDLSYPFTEYELIKFTEPSNKTNDLKLLPPKQYVLNIKSNQSLYIMSVKAMWCYLIANGIKKNENKTYCLNEKAIDHFNNAGLIGIQCSTTNYADMTQNESLYFDQRILCYFCDNKVITKSELFHYKEPKIRISIQDKIETVLQPLRGNVVAIGRITNEYNMSKENEAESAFNADPLFTSYPTNTKFVWNLGGIVKLNKFIPCKGAERLTEIKQNDEKYKTMMNSIKEQLKHNNYKVIEPDNKWREVMQILAMKKLQRIVAENYNFNGIKNISRIVDEMQFIAKSIDHYNQLQIENNNNNDNNNIDLIKKSHHKSAMSIDDEMEQIFEGNNNNNNNNNKYIIGDCMDCGIPTDSQLCDKCMIKL